MDVGVTNGTAVRTPTVSHYQTAIPFEIIQMIDEVGALQDEAEAMAKRIKILQARLRPYSEKLKQLADAVSKYATELGLGPDQEFTQTTDDFVLIAGKASTVRTVIDTQRAMKIIGRKLFFEKCTIGLGIIDQYLTPEKKQKVVRIERCTRGIKVFRRPTQS